MKKREWDVVRAKQLYDEGLDDLAIADMVGATEGAIKAWRAANRLKTNAVSVRGKRTVTPMPDPAAAPTGSSWKPIAPDRAVPTESLPEIARTSTPPRDSFCTSCSSNQRTAGTARGVFDIRSAGTGARVHPVFPHGPQSDRRLLRAVCHRRRSGNYPSVGLGPHHCCGTPA